MKNRKLTGLLGAFLALSMALSVGTALSFAKPHQPAEIVLAEGEEEPTSSSEETPAANDESSTPAQQESAQESSSSSSSSSSSVLSKAKKALKIILKTLKDAIKDLINKFRQKANI